MKTIIFTLILGIFLQSTAFAQTEGTLEQRIADLQARIERAQSTEEMLALSDELIALTDEYIARHPVKPAPVIPNEVRTVKADKFGASRHNLDVWGSFRKIIIRCVEGQVVFENTPRVIAQSEERVPMNYIYKMRAGETVEFDLGHYTFDRHYGQRYSETLDVRSLILDISSPNIIGSRGRLEIEFVR
ncbi:hypothetical protein ACES2I_11095 [Bdellovibrio bacteriovorus]|uniref:hypothetical protein n=1 Tax=Bdellovibrio bacteriovorus TaxID=959 RepID=UPI0035A6E3DB